MLKFDYCSSQAKTSMLLGSFWAPLLVMFNPVFHHFWNLSFPHDWGREECLIHRLSFAFVSIACVHVTIWAISVLLWFTLGFLKPKQLFLIFPFTSNKKEIQSIIFKYAGNIYCTLTRCLSIIVHASLNFHPNPTLLRLRLLPLFFKYIILSTKGVK